MPITPSSVRFHVYVDQYARPHLTISGLDQMVLDILRTAFGRSKVQCVSVYSVDSQEWYVSGLWRI